jgi:hypothetical protein
VKGSLGAGQDSGPVDDSALVTVDSSRPENSLEIAKGIRLSQVGSLGDRHYISAESRLHVGYSAVGRLESVEEDIVRCWGVGRPLLKMSPGDHQHSLEKSSA